MVDIPDSKELKKQRMETLGILSGGIAHDVNNILTGILGHVSYLMATLPGTGPHIASLKAIEEGCRKSALLTRQILNYSRTDVAESPIDIDLSALVSGLCNLLRGAISRQYRLLFEVPGLPIIVRGIEGHIAQVVINLVVNARDALSPNGEIRISLKSVERLGGEDGSEDHSLIGKFACLCVADNGHGIAPEILTRIFEPGFSTKQGKGTGLGLATVQAIIRQHGGSIDISSHVGIGTRMLVYLPISESDQNQRVSPIDREPIPSGKERLLIVDDELPVRNVLGLSLERLGYQVALAANGDEALGLFCDGSRIDLVILDMIMPGLSGLEVFRKLCEIKPNVRVLICSAYSSDDSIDEILQHGGCGYIQKPFAVEDLARKVRSCLDS